ncbi:hypothetical protein F4818DRAFT_457701 [Hypoxylon cercidicola]|nr:hypothetical protein F4818DRAFT_457701 [Hypoxylon cercidicola]
MSSATNPITYPHDELKIDQAEVREVEGMGLGLFATENISAGTIILLDTPVLTLKNDESAFEFSLAYVNAPDYVTALLDNGAFSEGRYARQLRVKTEMFRHFWMTKYNLPWGDDYWHPLADNVMRAFSIFQNNSAEIGGAPGLHPSGFYPTFSRINHSCAPTATWRTGPGPEYIMTVRAATDIAAGDQIFVCYDYRLTDQHRNLTRAQRQIICGSWYFESQHEDFRERRLCLGPTPMEEMVAYTGKDSPLNMGPRI